MNIRFSEVAVWETFEYPSEDLALQLYLEEHPADTEDVLFLDGFGGGGGGGGAGGGMAVSHLLRAIT